MTRWIALVVAFVTGGCAAPVDDDVWHGDESFTTEQRTDIESSMRWMTEHAGAPEVEIVWDHHGSSCERSIVVADLPAGTIGDSSRNGCIRIDTAQGFDRVGAIAAHEMTHVRMGPGHHHDVGLMNVNVPIVVMWTVADDQVTTAWAPE